MTDGVHEVAGAISGEGAAGAIGSVGSRGKAEDEETGAGISEAGNGTSPVGLILIRAAAGFADQQPIDPHNSDDAYRRNRRIELKLTER